MKNLLWPSPYNCLRHFLGTNTLIWGKKTPVCKFVIRIAIVLKIYFLIWSFNLESWQFANIICYVSFFYNMKNTCILTDRLKELIKRLRRRKLMFLNLFEFIFDFKWQWTWNLSIIGGLTTSHIFLVFKLLLFYYVSYIFQLIQLLIYFRYCSKYWYGLEIQSMERNFFK